MGADILWYRKPAKTWIQGMPLGNGRMGAMVQGHLRNETIVLNDDTAWACGFTDRNNQESAAYLPEIRRLLMQGEPEKAQILAEMSMVGTPKKGSAYQMLGELNLIFADHCDDTMEVFREGTALTAMTELFGKRVQNYRRRLDMSEAAAHVSYELDGAAYTREFIISRPDNVMAVRLATGQAKGLQVGVSLSRRFDAKVTTEGGSCIRMEGQCGRGGSRFCVILSAETPDGKIRTVGDYLYIEQASEIILKIVCETDQRCGEYVAVCDERINSLGNISYSDIRKRHTEEFQSYFNRMQLQLSHDPGLLLLSTDERMDRIRRGERDNGIIGSYFNFGRYLLISCSRPGSEAANLQGIWCNSFVPEWDSKYTININTQMNYWPAEACGLGDCHLPLFGLIEKARVNGRETAGRMYGCRGFVIHHNTDLWGDTAPYDHTRAGLWPMGGAWLCYHLWEHYLYSCDLDFLRERAYPLMKESAEFFLDYLTEDEKGQLLSGPSLSPENRYITDDGQMGSLCMSPAMDTQIIRGLFTRCLDAASRLGISDDFTVRVSECMEKLVPMKIGKEGVLQEWMEDYQETDPGHRHISHLFAVYPDVQINREETPGLFAAARRSLEKRLENDGGGTGWSLAWMTAFWARFGEAERAEETLYKLLRNMTEDSLLDIHPPHTFQIDGNLGAAAGITEMLLDCRKDTVYLMPALPAHWEEGSVKGLRAYGGLEIDMEWTKGICSVTFHAHKDIKKLIRTGADHLEGCTVELKEGESFRWEFAV